MREGHHLEFEPVSNQDTKSPKLGHHLDFEPVSNHVATSVWNVGSMVLGEK